MHMQTGVARACMELVHLDFTPFDLYSEPKSWLMKFGNIACTQLSLIMKKYIQYQFPVIDKQEDKAIDLLPASGLCSTCHLAGHLPTRHVTISAPIITQFWLYYYSE
jgi:hypothetical protein